MLYPMFVRHQPFGGFSGELPDLPGCVPEGDTLEEMLDNVQSAALLWLEERHASVLPEPSASEDYDDADCPPMLVEILPPESPQTSND
ncbi:type II toxin-antitoxin system HicB family antitoxin [uncultured Mailhella sp.]|uniref:type II toxin-antitoxin system HicB family antitoxin n=1 Tax=uncultured Mailhella sp. TaxID=1981031 RepID=UPI00320A1642